MLLVRLVNNIYKNYLRKDQALREHHSKQNYHK
jgi:hypothetical protein